MYERTHPVTVLSNLWRVFYLIIIPVLRGFFLALQKDLLAWMAGAWADILVFLLMLAIAALQWHCQRYAFNEKMISVRSGILYKKETTIYWDKITAASVTGSFYLRPFGAVQFRADTIGGSHRKADLIMFLGRDSARRVMEAREAGAGPAVNRQYIPEAASILSLSILTSNSFAGIIFISTFISQSGKLLGNEFANTIIYTFEDLARSLAFGIPPAAAAMAYMLLGGWLIGFLLTLISYRDFAAVRRDFILGIKGGAVTRREYSISYDKISFIEIRQNVAAMLFKLYSLYIYAVGYGKRKDDISCVIPSVRHSSFTEGRLMLFPDFAFSSPTLKSPGTALVRFISQPLIPAVSLTVTMIISARLFPSWESFILFTGFMLMIPCAFFMVIRIIAFRTGGVSKKDNCYTLRYSSSFSIHTVVIPEEKIALVSFRQSFFQARDKRPTCDLIVSTIAEGKRRHMCRSIDLESVKRIFGIRADSKRPRAM